MKNLLSLKFWFAARPPALLPIYFKIFIAVLILFVILTFISWFLLKKKNIYRKIWDRVNTFAITNIFLGLVILFFSYELIPFLSSRFWILIWGLVILVWLFFIFKDLTEMPAIREQRQREHEYKKYIP